MKGHGFIALAKKNDVPRTTLQGWWARRSELKVALKFAYIATKKSKSLSRGG